MFYQHGSVIHLKMYNFIKSMEDLCDHLHFLNQVVWWVYLEHSSRRLKGLGQPTTWIHLSPFLKNIVLLETYINSYSYYTLYKTSILQSNSLTGSPLARKPAGYHYHQFLPSLKITNFMVTQGKLCISQPNIPFWHTYMYIHKITV